MRISSLAPYALSVLAAAALLAGCSNGGSQSSALTPTGFTQAQASKLHLANGTIPAAAVKPIFANSLHPNHHKSWVSPDAAKAPRLLFISDVVYGTVNIFTMPGLALKGTITGLSAPEGECADAAGNVWVVEDTGESVVKLSRTGSMITSVSTSGYGPPGACAVDPRTGDLAVTTFFNAGESGPGSMLVYKHASGTPKAYGNKAQGTFYFAAYDGHGDLFADGCAAYPCSSGQYVLSELRARTRKMVTVSISGGTIEFPGNLVWSKKNKYLNAFDQLCGGVNAACAYWVTIAGSAGTITGTSGNFLNSTGGQACDLVSPIIGANGENFAAGADFEFCTSPPTDNVYRWPNPTGGKPTGTYANTDVVVESLGTAVSTKNSGSQ